MKLKTNRRSKQRRFGFSIMEILISISVISIAMLGVLGSLAFARGSSRQTTQLTEAAALQRRIMELILIGGSRGPYLPNNNLNNGAGSPYDGQWHSLGYFLDQDGTNAANPVNMRDFLINSADESNPNSEDYKRLQELITKNYQIRVTLTPGDTINHPYESDMCTVMSEVRWPIEGGRFRSITTSSKYRRGTSQ